MASRNAYTYTDNRKLVEFIYRQLKAANSDAWNPKGNAIWRLAAEHHVTTHTYQSMRDHFRRHLLPDLEQQAQFLTIDQRTVLVRRFRHFIEEASRVQASVKQKRNGNNKNGNTRPSSSRSGHAHAVTRKPLHARNSTKQLVAHSTIKAARRSHGSRNSPAASISEDAPTRMSPRKASARTRRSGATGVIYDKELDEDASGSHTDEGTDGVVRMKSDLLDLLIHDRLDLARMRSLSSRMDALCLSAYKHGVSAEVLGQLITEGKGYAGIERALRNYGSDYFARM